MKIGVISDIHANFTAFKAVLADAKKSKVEKFIFVGDILGIGARPKECLELLRELDLLACVRGNHDECFDILQENYYEHPKFIKTYMYQLYESKYLEANDYEYLRSLPYVEYVEIGNLKIKVMHALNEDSSYPKLLAASEQENFDKMFDNEDSDTVIYGHIHRQIFRNASDDRQIINPGSVGSTFGYNPLLIGHAQYCILTIDDYIVSNEFKSIKYDIEPEIIELDKRDAPYKELVINELKTGEYYSFDDLFEYEDKHNYKHIVLEHIKNR